MSFSLGAILAKAKSDRASPWTKTKILRGLGAWLCCLWLTACAAPETGDKLAVRVVRVTNGQELEVASNSGFPEITERIRLEGLVAPGLTQPPWGEAARAALAQLVTNQSVLLEMDMELRDATGQRLAYLWRGNELINLTLVGQGHALALPHPPNNRYDRQLAYAQERARVLGLGIWNPAQPLRQLPPTLPDRPIAPSGHSPS